MARYALLHKYLFIIPAVSFVLTAYAQLPDDKKNYGLSRTKGYNLMVKIIQRW